MPDACVTCAAHDLILHQVLTPIGLATFPGNVEIATWSLWSGSG